MGLEIGKNYFVRTNNDHYVGRLVEIIGPYTLALEDASWVAQSGRLSVFCKEGTAEHMEIEPVGYMPRIHYQAIIEWPHKLFPEAIP